MAPKKLSCLRSLLLPLSLTLLLPQTGPRSAMCLAACTTFGYRGCFGATGF
ncbi:GLB1L isoform 7 [Pan troglodytes]|uniref:GLB1L isoform 7 n=1 Tax=Pan troglodytes TaxID=9598 RepID=A0A2J8NG46_PANTR|nr:GLB1L isoform 7 [Pan troglodytes]